MQAVFSKAAVEKYKTANQWSEFYVEAYDFGDSDTPEEPMVCAAPTISIIDGELYIESPTSGATCYYTITSEDMMRGNTNTGNTIALTGQYTITAYATAEGYSDSETVTAILVWMNPIITDENKVIPMEARKALVIRSNGNKLQIYGTEPGENILLYSIDGILLASTISKENTTNINYPLTEGEIYIVKYGKKVVKCCF